MLYLQLDDLRLDLERLDLEIHSDGRDVFLRVLVVDEPVQERAFADVLTSYQDDLEDIVDLLGDNGLVLLAHDEVPPPLFVLFLYIYFPFN